MQNAFSKDVKKRLVDLEKNQAWLIGAVRQDTGLYLDSGYMGRILSGKRHAPKIRASICKILDIPEPEKEESKSEAST